MFGSYTDVVPESWWKRISFTEPPTGFISLNNCPSDLSFLIMASMRALAAAALSLLYICTVSDDESDLAVLRWVQSNAEGNGRSEGVENR